MTKLSKGDSVFLSESGHKEFQYPTKEKEVILFDVEVEIRSWVGGDPGLRAVTVPENAVFALGNPTKLISVWIPKT